MKTVLLGLFVVAVTASSTPPSSGGGGPQQALSAFGELLRRQEEQWRGRLHQLNSARPPPGAVYVGTMNMPVIGRQTFVLRLLGRQRCQIVLIGPLSLNEPATYAEERVRKREDTLVLAVDFNAATLDFLKAWRTRIRECTWHVDGDYATILIKAPVIPAIRVKMCARFFLGRPAGALVGCIYPCVRACVCVFFVFAGLTRVRACSSLTSRQRTAPSDVPPGVF